MTSPQQIAYAVQLQNYVDNVTVNYATLFQNAINSCLPAVTNALTYRFSSDGVASIVESVVKLAVSKVYYTLYSVFAKEYGSAYARMFVPLIRKSDEFDEWDPYEDPQMREWIASTTATRITKIGASTSAGVRVIIDRALQQNVPLQDVVKELQAAYAFSKERATKIARTEIVAASNATSHFVMGKFIDPSSMRKAWLATSDKRTRQTHIAANGQDQEYNDPFQVGGSKLLFPGDTSLGAAGKEVIACRCTVLYIPK